MHELEAELAELESDPQASDEEKRRLYEVLCSEEETLLKDIEAARRILSRLISEQQRAAGLVVRANRLVRQNAQTT